MSWFLRSKPTKGKKKKPIERTPEQRRARTLLVLRIAGVVIGLSLVAGGWFGGEKWLKQRIAEQRRDTPTITLHHLPTWMPEPLSKQLEQRVAAVLSTDPFDRDALANAATQLEDSAWVERLIRIMRRPGNHVDVYAEYRIPAALVEAEGRYHLVDHAGVRLPLVYERSSVEKMPLVTLRGVQREAPPQGRLWQGKDLIAGLQVTQLVMTQPWARQIKSVDVTNFDGRRWRNRPHIVLNTRHGEIRWGRAPGDEGVHEPAVETKLQHLQRMQMKFGSVDDGGQIIDVTGDTVWKQEPPVPLPGESDEPDTRYTLSR